MLVSSQVAYVARKVLLTKDGKQCPLAHFSDGADVMDCIDSNELTKGLAPGSVCDVTFDLSTNKVLRLSKVSLVE